MAIEKLLAPDYIFETSWEVCNKVGGIYTVLSTRANTIQEKIHDNLIFIGPDLGADIGNSDFLPIENGLFDSWKSFATQSEGLKIRIGRWDIPSKPVVILIDFQDFFAEKDALYFLMWDKFGVKSMNAYGDYDESCMFAYATGLLIESFYKFHKLQDKKVVAHFNEWMLGMGALYIKNKLPGIATIFTTHATSIGRSIAGNGKKLYAYFDQYDGDIMAQELNMEAKHSLEKQAAWHADCFTTVSELTACECGQLLKKLPDVVTPNGFEDDFVPKGAKFTRVRENARKSLLNVAKCLTGEDIHSDSLIVATSGRYEYKNKGIDVYIEALDRVRKSNDLDQTIIAFIIVPAWSIGPRLDLQARLESKEKYSTPLINPYITHELHEQESDHVCNYIKYLDFINNKSDKVKIFFVPSYINESDGILNLSYYDVLAGIDLTIFPSYYEPWGYTPLESIAFGIPSITTNLAGFGIWAMQNGVSTQLSQGVSVEERTDENYFHVAESIKDSIIGYANCAAKDKNAARKAARKLAEKASWKNFIEHYYTAYNIALREVEKR